MQEPIYYVIEDNRTLCEDIRCRADASDIPPPEESSSAAHDQPPAYQNITELSSKNNGDIGRNDKDKGNNQDDSIFSNPNSPHSPSIQ